VSDGILQFLVPSTFLTEDVFVAMPTEEGDKALGRDN